MIIHDFIASDSMMMQTLPASEYIFPDPVAADPEGQGLICIGADLSPSTLFEAYTHGLFPWFSAGEPICWWSPEPRCIIRPQDYHPSKSLVRNMKKMDYKITVNHAFETVIRSCSLPRSYADETWISEEMLWLQRRGLGQRANCRRPLRHLHWPWLFRRINVQQAN